MLEEALGARPAAQGVHVQLEEKPFLRPKSRIAVPCPGPARVVRADRACLARHVTRWDELTSLLLTVSPPALLGAREDVQ
jgi:hypothetical protein